MNHEFRFAADPSDVRMYGTEKLREKFLMEKVFVEDQINVIYSMYDRFIVGGAMPVGKDLRLETLPYLKSDNFLDRRELGIVNVGDAGEIRVDGKSYTLDRKEALYVGLGHKEVIFTAPSAGRPLYYLNSAPAHQGYPVKKIGRDEAIVIELGDQKFANKRTLNKLLVNELVETCQLQMGLTELQEGNVWNTMPAHTHHRRMEAYFYFDLEEGQTISHFMGEPAHTRHIFLQNHQAVLSPEWSIHSGAGTTNYSFIWGMAGENLDYGDMDVRQPNELS